MEVGYSFNGRGIVFTRGAIRILVHRLMKSSKNKLHRYFNVFDYMQLNSSAEFEVTYLKGSNLVFQAHTKTNCDFTGVDPFSSSTDTVIPNQIESKMQICTSAKLRALFTDALEMVKNQNNLEPENVDQAVQLFLETYVESLCEAYDLLSTTAGTYGTSTLAGSNFYATVSAAEQARFNSQMVTSGAVGYMKKLVVDYTANPTTKAHLSVQTAIVAGDLDASLNLTTSVVDIFYRLKNAATSDMKTAINMGSTTIGGVTKRPVFLVDNYMYDNLVTEFEAQGDLAAKEYAKIKMREVLVDGEPMNVFFINGVPVVVDANINAPDSYIKRKTYFACITLSGAIGIGNSFGDLKKADEANDFPMEFEMSELMADRGTLRAQVKGLQVSHVNDDRYIVAGQFIAVVP